MNTFNLPLSYHMSHKPRAPNSLPLVYYVLSVYIHYLTIHEIYKCVDLTCYESFFFLQDIISIIV